VSDGPGSAAWYEHRRVADALDIYLFSLDQIENHGGAIYGRDDDGLLKPIDVIYRRTDLDRLRLASGALSHFGELMLGPIRENTVACVNAFGSGIADDKLIHAYVEDMIVFYLSEEPILESVTTYDPTDPETRAMVDERINELVVKPRGGLGGKGVTVGRTATPAELEAARSELEKSPEDWVVQETVALSTHPTVIGDSLEPRHIDLRPYAIHLGEEARTLPACLTRVALEKGSLIVNSSQNGGAKDTWITAE
jgi:carboxylate-amine ligase